MVLERLSEISNEILTQKKLVEIKRYVKKMNKTRIKEGMSNVVLDVNLPPYIDLLNLSLRELSNIKIKHKTKIQELYDASSKEVDVAFEEIEKSLKNSIKNYDSKSSMREGEIYVGAGITYNQEESTIYFVGKTVKEKVLISEETLATNSRLKTKIKTYINEILPHAVKRYKISTTELNKVRLVANA